MQPAKSPVQRALAYALCALLSCPVLPARAFNENLTDIANSPVTQPATSSMQPNILLILDDSGSMARQFTPDYVNTHITPSGTNIRKNCFDSKDAGTQSGSSGSITTSPDECWAGDPPAMTPDFNVQYYNPEIRYRPAVDYTAIERISMTCANSGGSEITAISTGATTLLTVPNTVTVGSVQSIVGFTGADAAFLNNKAFTVASRTATTMTIDADTTGKAFSIGTPRPCTGGWTAAITDNVSAVGSNYARKNLTDFQGGPGSATGTWGNDSSHSGGGPATLNTLNLTTQWPDRVWCRAASDAASSTANCKINNDYQYPNNVFAFGLDASSARKYRFGAPYFYRIVVKDYCTDARMNDCLPLCEGAATPPACIVSATSPDNVVAGKTYAVAAPVRFCTSSTLADCHAKRSATREYPKFLGNLFSPAPATPTAATATIYLGVPSGSPVVYGPQPDQNSAGVASAAEGRISSITVTKDAEFGGAVYNVGAGAVLSLAAAATNSTWADTIETRIDANVGTTGFSATSPGATVVISAPANPAGTLDGLGNDDSAESYIGATVQITTETAVHTQSASYVITFNGVAQNNACTGTWPNLSCATVSSLVADGVELLLPVATTAVRCNHADCNSGTSSTRNNRMATIFSTHFNANLPTGWTRDAPGTGTPVLAANQVRIKAPTTGGGPLGSAMNGKTVSLSRNAQHTTTVSGVMCCGATQKDVAFNVTTFAGAANGGALRSNVANFSRVNLVPGQDYNFYPDRGDCVEKAGFCTYKEEMTNFANWFAYYRTRIQTAKTAIGRAFALAGIGDNFRVGFKTINFSSTRYLAVAPFATGSGNQKDLWFQELYAAPATGSTPLIGALTRAGRYFADRNPSSMGQTPINSACQPNYAILTTDGYWNDGASAADKIDGSALGDSDGDGRSGTLADVAHYYYNTDLLPVPAVAPAIAAFKNQVPPSGDDTAPHQHMTTFTVGMGVSGGLLFHPSYQTPGNSLDYDAIVASTGGEIGSSLWPSPVGDTESTIDDLWHAAVNGKGRFFSAQNPVALAAGINEVLTAVQKRVGAGAAAATSNLQPVAGDNFAFTAQYQTVEWSGDLKARTISLTDGVVGERELWSAKNQLDLRTFADRKIYTFDVSDTTPGTVVADAAADGADLTQNGNRLRSFCRPDVSLSTIPTCTEGLLTVAEKDEHFDPLGGPNGALGQAAGWPALDARRTAASSNNNTYLFRFLRGERAREITLGGTSATDLFRVRASILGDIVNAQPAYVKASPFSYSAATDPFYTTFQATTNGQSGTRKGSVYVAANDGMLHAFETDPDNNPYYQNAGVSTLTDATDDTFTGTLNTDPIVGEGAERWAYVPNLIFPTMKRLAEENYPTNHKFFTDGSPAIGDVCFGHSTATPCSSAASWKTILVAGLNAGGRGFYALDITDPNNPKGLWEVAGGAQALVSGSVKCLTNAEANSGLYGVDCNIGLSFGNPVIAKRAEDGKWVVFISSGYNNVNPGSGMGYLYMLDAQTGKILRRMTTGVGCAVNDDPDVPGGCAANTDDPSGFARINAWVDSATTNNTALAVYGGDLKGNVWRFQLEDTTAVPRYSVTRIATVQADGGVVQPITVRPDLALVSTKRVIFFGTGKFLGSTDKTNLTRQSIYAIKDDLSGVVSPQVNMTRPGAGTITGFIKQTLTEDTTSTRTVATPQIVNFNSDNGWFIDLPDGGTGEEAAERVSVDPIIQLGTLVVASNVPSTETCLAGGSGWVNFLDIKSGAAITGTTSNPASVKVSGSLIVGINIVKIGDQIKTIVTTADNQQLTKDTPVAATGVSGRRVSWRELIVE